MGCDIHVVVERRTDAAAPWLRIQTRGYFQRPNRYDISARDWRELRPGEIDQPDALTQRNYDVFALLAGVRNGYDWRPLDEPRGVPSDATVDDAAASGDDWLGDHSHSHATVAELLAFFANVQHVTKDGVIPLDEYIKWAWRDWDQRRAPHDYSGDISGPGIVVINEVDRDRAKTIDAAKATGEPRPHVRATWPENSLTSARHFYECALPWLTAIGSPEHVRIVFGFDS
jgi:hypothetical protein